MNKSKFLVYSFMLILISLVILLSQTGQKFEPKKRIEKIIIENNQFIPESEILRYANLLSPNETSHLTPDVVLDRIERHPYIIDAIGQFIDSITFVVQINEEKPEFIIQSDGELFVLTANNKILKYNKNIIISDVPVITGIGLDENKKFEYNGIVKINTAKKIFNTLKQTNELLSELLSELNFEKDKINLFFAEPKTKVIIGLDFNYAVAEKLNIFWEKVIVPSNSNNFAFIDMRFKDEVVTKEKQI